MFNLSNSFRYIQIAHQLVPSSGWMRIFIFKDVASIKDAMKHTQILEIMES